jgi:hypothetical protein
MGGLRLSAVQQDALHLEELLPVLRQQASGRLDATVDRSPRSDVGDGDGLCKPEKTSALSTIDNTRPMSPGRPIVFAEKAEKKAGTQWVQ